MIESDVERFLCRRVQRRGNDPTFTSAVVDERTRPLVPPPGSPPRPPGRAERDRRGPLPANISRTTPDQAAAEKHGPGRSRNVKKLVVDTNTDCYFARDVDRAVAVRIGSDDDEFVAKTLPPVALAGETDVWSWSIGRGCAAVHLINKFDMAPRFKVEAVQRWFKTAGAAGRSGRHRRLEALAQRLAKALQSTDLNDPSTDLVVRHGETGGSG